MFETFEISTLEFVSDFELSEFEFNKNLCQI